jgi:hypothetical protein
MGWRAHDGTLRVHNGRGRAAADHADHTGMRAHATRTANGSLGGAQSQSHAHAHATSHRTAATTRPTATTSTSTAAAAKFQQPFLVALVIRPQPPREVVRRLLAHRNAHRTHHRRGVSVQPLAGRALDRDCGGLGAHKVCAAGERAAGMVGMVGMGIGDEHSIIRVEKTLAYPTNICSKK